MRVGIIALQHETNTFIQTPTDLDAFRGGMLATGDEFRDAVEGSNHELAGFFAGLDMRPASRRFRSSVRGHCPTAWFPTAPTRN